MGFYGYIADDYALIQEYLGNGALVIDVRTPDEFIEGHAPDCELIQMHEIPTQVERFRSMETPLILVCKTGARAAMAKNYLKRFGIDVINGGPWQNVL